MAKVFNSWAKYDNKQKTIDQLLKTCTQLNGQACDNSAHAISTLIVNKTKDSRKKCLLIVSLVIKCSYFEYSVIFIY